MSWLFYQLNLLQYVMQKPWRWMLRRPGKGLMFLNTFLWFIPRLIQLGLYFFLAPLRFINACYYNIWVHVIWSLRDHLSEIFHPKLKGMRHKSGISYVFFWAVGFPIRMLRYSIKAIIQLCEGLAFVAVDTVFPALTMYHGTKLESSIAISKPGKWVVGTGNFAGSGLYFGIKKHVGMHYASSRRDPVVICSRVTLGSVVNLNISRKEVKKHIRVNGDAITQWGKEKGYKTCEWWREDKKWWEYCLLHKRDNNAVDTWRIRVLYIQHIKDNKKQRVWGGKAYWLF